MPSFKGVERKIKTAGQHQTTSIRKGIKYGSSECKECIPMSILRYYLIVEFSPLNSTKKKVWESSIRFVSISVLPTRLFLSSPIATL